jgi:hypothetical protein
MGVSASPLLRLLKFPLFAGAGAYGFYINGVQDLPALRDWYRTHAKPRLAPFCPVLARRPPAPFPSCYDRTESLRGGQENNGAEG